MSDILYAGAHWIGPAYVDNFMVGRQGHAVDGIIDHHSASTLQGLIARFTTSSGVSGGGTSAHFAIDRDGTRYQLVDTADTAFHAGDFNANLTKIGIEHVRLWGSGPGTPGYEAITDAQYQSSHELHVILAADNGFPLDLAHVHPHHDYIQTTCPGDLDLARIITPQIGVADMDPTEHGWLADLRNVATNGLVGGGTKSYNTQQLDEILAVVKAGGGGDVDLAPILAAIADLKAHPAVVADPALLAAVQKIDAHFTGK